MCCALFNKQTKEIEEPAPLIEYAYASSHMQISSFSSVRTTMFVSFFFFKCTARKTSSFSGKRLYARVRTNAELVLECFPSLEKGKKNKKNLCDGLKYEKFRGDALEVFHLFCAARQESSGRRGPCQNKSGFPRRRSNMTVLLVDFDQDDLLSFPGKVAQ